MSSASGLAASLAALPMVLLASLIGVSAASAQTTYHVASNGGGSSCSTTSPCGLSTALSQASGGDGDVIVLFGPGEGHGTGKYDAITLDDPTRHANLTVTATSAAIGALSFRRGVATGVDSRPQILGTGGAQLTIEKGVSGATVSYLRIRGNTAPNADNGWWNIVEVRAPATVDHCEIWNGGQGIRIRHRRDVTITDNHIHDTGNPNGPSGADNHGIEICCDSGAVSTSWATAIVIDNNTIADSGGDAVQENTANYCDGTFSYLVVSNNDAYGHKEQGVDMKGTQYMKVFGNDFHDNDFGGVTCQENGDSGGRRHDYWYIYGNRFHDHANYAIGCEQSNCRFWYIWNNVFYNNGHSQDYSSYGTIWGPPQDSEVAHNVFWNNSGGGVVRSGSDARDTVNVRNNIFYENGEEGGVESGFAISHNWFNGGDPGERGSNALEGTNPHFRNTVSVPYDFHVELNTSSAVQAGVELTGTTHYTIGIDAEGRQRGSMPRLGAYEGSESVGGVDARVLDAGSDGRTPCMPSCNDGACEEDGCGGMCDACPMETTRAGTASGESSDALQGGCRASPASPSSVLLAWLLLLGLCARIRRGVGLRSPFGATVLP